MKMGEAGAFAGQLIEVRRLKSLGSEAADIAIPLVVGENHDDIWFARRGGKSGVD
jgi:hypothetical protein